MNKTKSQSLTPKDLQASNWIAEQGPIRQSTLNRHFAISNQTMDPRSIRRLTNRLIAKGLINKEQILKGSPILWPTVDGLRLAGFDLRKGEHNLRPSLSTIMHSIQVAEVRVIYEANHAEWFCERKLRRKFKDHLPDGMAFYEDSQIIVEIDRTRKNKDRLIDIMKTNIGAYSGNYFVDYWTTPEVFDFVKAQTSLLPDKLQSNIRVFLIPGDLL